MDKDLFEEFEFKPLTDGLGFNKKPQPAQNQNMMSSASLNEDLLSSEPIKPTKKKFEDVLATLEKSPLPKATSSSLEFVGALPRDPKETIPPPTMNSVMQTASIGMTMPTISPFPSMDVYKKTNDAASARATTATSGTGVRRGGHDSLAPNLEAVPVSFASACLDLIVVFAVFLVFLSTLLLITGVELGSVMSQIENNPATKISMSVLFLAVLQIYVVLSRSLFGQTLGEWTFDMQMGKTEEQKSEMYPLKVLGRSLLMLATGLVVIPILSLIANQDLAAKITGVQLYRQRI